MVAEPMFRAGKPDIVAESNLYGCWAEDAKQEDAKQRERTARTNNKEA